MELTITGATYVFGFAALSLLTLRFWQYFKREQGVMSRMIFYFGLSFSIFAFFTAAISVFFASSAAMLKIAVVQAVFFQGLGISFFSYLLAYFLKKSFFPAKIAFSLSFAVTVAATFFAIFLPFQPHLVKEALAIDWSVPPIVDTLRATIYLLTFIPLSFVFFRSLTVVQDPIARLKSFAFGFLMMVGTLAISVEFIFEKIFNLGVASGDIALIVTYAIIIFIALLPSRAKPKEDQKA